MSLYDKLEKVINFTVKNEDNIKKAIEYFRKYGYLRAKVGDILKGEISLENVLTAIRNFQSVAGISETGVIDGQTLRMMDYPRCSITDDFDTEALASDNLRWSKKHLYYYLSGIDTNDMTAALWRSTIRKAFDNISAVCGLTFEEVNNINESNLVLGTGRGSKDDFDGNSGTLAWFQLPNSYNFAGRLSGKFDLDEFWLGIGQTGRGIYLLNVATHEILHGLGLRHSRISKALMAPIYSPSIAVPQQNDDISRLLPLYGPPKEIIIPTPPPVIPVPPPTNNSDLIINIKGSVTGIDIPGYRIIKIG